MAIMDKVLLSLKAQSISQLGGQSSQKLMYIDEFNYLKDRINKLH
jgi:hypothetical protein